MTNERPIDYPKTPYLDKTLKIKEQSQAIGEFMEWCNEKGWHLGEFKPDSYYMHPIREVNIQKILADLFGIDYDAMNKEQDEILRYAREH